MLNLWLEPRIPTSYMAADVKKIWQELNGAGCKDVDSLGWLDCAEATEMCIRDSLWLAFTNRP